MNEYIFVVDTEQYAGNFERQMCAFITGQVGECEVGQEEAEKARPALGAAAKWFGDHVRQEMDEHGCSRPCSIWHTPGWLNDGHGNHYRVEDGPDMAAFEAALQKHDDHYYYKQARENLAAGEEQWRATVEGNEKTLASWRARGPGAVAAFNSVAIFLDEIPPPEIARLMRERAIMFAAEWPSMAEWNGKIVVTGTRLMERLVEYRDIEMEAG